MVYQKNHVTNAVCSYGRQHIDAGDKRAVMRVLGSDFLTQGPEVGRFEQALAEYCGARYAVAVANGTAALHLAYRAAGIGAGDEIITTPNTFAATTNMAIVCGARPVFCDIREDTLNIDETNIEALVTKRTKAIVPVHFAGHPCEMDTIMRIARLHKLLVIEDACHALGARYKGKTVGGIGDMTIFSFHPVKSITTGEGGAIITNNKRFYETILSLRSHGIHKDAGGKNVMTDLGYNYRLTDIQAALGRSQLKKIDRFIRARRRLAAYYAKVFGGIKEIILPQTLSEAYSAWHLYVVRVKNPHSRDPLLRYLKQKGIGANVHYPAVYSHPYYRAHGYGETKLPIAERYQNSCITLPLHPDLTRADIAYVGDTIKDFLGFTKNPQ